MTMNKIYPIISTVAIVVLAFLLIDVSNTNNTLRQLYKHNLSVAHDSIKTMVDKYGRTVSEKKAYEISLRDMKSLNDSLITILSNQKVKTLLKYKTVTKYKDTIIFKFDTIIDQKFSYNFKYRQKWLSFNADVTNKDFSLSNIKIPTEYSLIVGYKKDGFFKPRYANASIVITNPHVEVMNMQSYVIKPKKTIWDKWWLWTVVGGAAGIIIMK